MGKSKERLCQQEETPSSEMISKNLSQSDQEADHHSDYQQVVAKHKELTVEIKPTDLEVVAKT